jgi:hypothetical protein
MNRPAEHDGRPSLIHVEKLPSGRVLSRRHARHRQRAPARRLGQIDVREHYLLPPRNIAAGKSPAAAEIEDRAVLSIEPQNIPPENGP